MISRSFACMGSTGFGLSLLAALIPTPGHCLGQLTGFPSSEEPADRLLPSALQLQVNPSGLEFITENIEDILLANGLNIRTQSLPAADISLPQPLRLDSIPVAYSGSTSTLAALASEIPKWISGLKLKNPQFRFHITKPRYEILNQGSDPLYFTAEVEPTSNDDSGNLHANGTVLIRLSAHIPSLVVQADSVDIQDPANPLLGVWSFKQPRIVLGAAGKPIVLHMKIELGGTGLGTITLKIVEISSNLAESAVSASFESMSTPRFDVTVNGKPVISVDRTRIERLLRSRLPELSSIARVKLDQLTRDSLPGQLEQLLKDILSKNEVGTAEIELPGLCSVPGCKPDPHWLRIGLSRAVSSPGWIPGSDGHDLRLKFLSEWDTNLAENPAIRAMRGFDSMFGPEESSILEGAEIAAHPKAQVIAVLDPRIYNYVLQESWDSGWRYSGAGLSLAEAPQVRMIETPGGAITYLDAPIHQAPKDFWQRQTFGRCGPGAPADPFRVDAAATLAVSKSRSVYNAVDLSINGLDLAASRIDSSQYSRCMLDGLFFIPADQRAPYLDSIILDSLKDESSRLRANPSLIVGGLELPASLLGVSMELLGAEMVNGLIYLQFKMTGVAQ